MAAIVEVTRLMPEMVSQSGRVFVICVTCEDRAKSPDTAIVTRPAAVQVLAYGSAIERNCVATIGDLLDAAPAAIAATALHTPALPELLREEASLPRDRAAIQLGSAQPANDKS